MDISDTDTYLHDLSESPGEEFLNQANDIVEDLTENHDLLSTNTSSDSLCFSEDTPRIKPRPYQLEMLNEALEKNIIVAMDTGSGKTHVAVLRILHELEAMAENQIIWFLAPTVDLCAQQDVYINSQIRAVQTRFLSGIDGVDRWTEQSHWDLILKDIKVVVSTYQILLDALSHGFVKITSLALIVFDEAHNCVGKHPGAKIMEGFYHPRKAQNLKVPHILGLTASPVMRSNPMSLVKIEHTLDAICRTPTKHRAELRLQVKLPVLTQKTYHAPPSPNSLISLSRCLKSLDKVAAGLLEKISEDPFVLKLKSDGSEKSQAKAQKVCLNGKTWCQGQMKTLQATCLRLAAELGIPAAEYYVSQVIYKHIEVAESGINYLGSWDISIPERQYLAKAMRDVEIDYFSDENPAPFTLLSDKVETLIRVLLEEPPGFAGIIFVQERAAVAVLAHLLSVHSATRGRFKIGTIVGTSSFTTRPYSVGELVDIKSQNETLSRFKSGAINLLVATSVLEEGIDVPACNLVICFQKPANLKSFVQRRGRARQRDSKLILLLDASDDKVSEWHQLELDMKKFYEDEMRTLQEVLSVEDTETHGDVVFRVESTNAMLDLDNALQHLYHFCATLPRAKYVDPRPEFICYKDGYSTVRATVILPLSVNEIVRVAKSQTVWKSERNAIKDAAFVAYVALYRAGLVNDNLLPLLRHDPVVDGLMTSAVETRASLMMANEQLNPWINVAEAWRDAKSVQHSTITIENLKMTLLLPEVHTMTPFKIYWDSNTEFDINIQHEVGKVEVGAIMQAVDDTWALLETSFGSRFPIQGRNHIVLFASHASVPLKHQMGQNLCSAHEGLYDIGLIRDPDFNNKAYIFKGFLSGKPPRETVLHPYDNYDDCPFNTPHVSLKRLTRRSDFLHKIPLGNKSVSQKLHSVVLPTSKCFVDRMPFTYVRFGLLIPSIMRRLEISLLANTLSKTLLESLDITNLDLIITAISASSANESSNYQRLEFIGDSVLKMCTSIQLMGKYPLWHEAYLSFGKDRLIANSRLSRAAIESGLDRFIITKSFTGLKWRPLYVDDLLQLTGGLKRQISSKVLADVVEALIGAAMVDGGLPKALRCLQLFLPEMEWQPLEDRRLFLFHRASNTNLPITLRPLEALIGYQFQKKALLIEAMTHASCNYGTSTYERLEFLGDSILDRIVVGALEEQECQLSHVQMHLFRTALVNADFLAFLCMELATSQSRADLKMDTPVSHGQPRLVEHTGAVVFPLWKFMRHHSPTIGIVQAETALRHGTLRDDINTAIKSGSHYPWALLARLQANKFYSDLVESLIGAVWIDSGSFDACRDIVERLGLLPYLRRILAENVHIWHPKEELGRLANTETVKYCVGIVETLPGVIAEKLFWCKVIVGETEIIEVRDGVAKEEVMTKAADIAVGILKNNTQNKGGDSDGVREILEPNKVAGIDSMIVDA